MRVVLFFPPLVLPSAVSPYPSLPLLAGYLKDRGRHQVECCDVNADVLGRLVGGPLEGLAQDEVERRFLEGLRQVYPGLVIDEQTFGRLRGTDYRQVFGHHALDYWHLGMDQVRSILEDERPDLLLQPVADSWVEAVVTGEPVLVAMSIAFATQLGCALSLAAYLRRLNPRVFVVFGGGVLRRCLHNAPRVPALFDVVDCFVRSEGEATLLELADRLERGDRWQETPGITCRHGGTVRSNPARPFDIATNGTPDYGLVNRHSYREPDHLCLRTSVGCYWDRCRFCTQALNRYQERRVGVVVGDMLALAGRWGARRLRLADEAVAVPRLLRIARGLLQRGSALEWTSDSRFDRPLTASECRLLLRSGCAALSFGLESAVQRVNDLMCKGVHVADASQTMEACLAEGLYCHANAIIGFPGETEAEMRTTVDFLRDRVERGLSASLSVFTLNHGSHVFTHPEQYGISHVEEAQDAFFKDSYHFEGPGVVPYERVLEIFEEAGL